MYINVPDLKHDYSRKDGVKEMPKNEIVMDDSLRLMRIKKSPIRSNENLLVVDWLERGFLRLYEYTGGSIYILGDAPEMDGCSNVAMVAELTVNIDQEKKTVKFGKVFNEFGYDYAHLMIRQLIHFADFYGYSISLLDLTKRKRCA